MQKLISRPMHGLLTDYPYIALVSSAPKLVGFQDEKNCFADVSPFKWHHYAF